MSFYCTFPQSNVFKSANLPPFSFSKWICYSTISVIPSQYSMLKDTRVLASQTHWQTVTYWLVSTFVVVLTLWPYAIPKVLHKSHQSRKLNPINQISVLPPASHRNSPLQRGNPQWCLGYVHKIHSQCQSTPSVLLNTIYIIMIPSSQCIGSVGTFQGWHCHNH